MPRSQGREPVTAGSLKQDVDAIAHKQRRLTISSFVLYAICAGLAIGCYVVAEEARDASDQIQVEREANVRALCRAQNRRHDNAIAKLDVLIARAPADERGRAKARRAATVTLLEALVPYEDCERLVRARVDTAGR